MTNLEIIFVMFCAAFAVLFTAINLVRSSKAAELMERIENQLGIFNANFGALKEKVTQQHNLQTDILSKFSDDAVRTNSTIERGLGQVTAELVTIQDERRKKEDCEKLMRLNIEALYRMKKMECVASYPDAIGDLNPETAAKVLFENYQTRVKINTLLKPMVDELLAKMEEEQAAKNQPELPIEKTEENKTEEKKVDDIPGRSNNPTTIADRYARMCESREKMKENGVANIYAELAKVFGYKSAKEAKRFMEKQDAKAAAKK